MMPMEPEQPVAPSVACLRCREWMTFAGTKKFHEGGYIVSVLLGEIFESRENLDMYVCLRCGRV
ncbi:MAG: hypothetical protein ACJ78Q_14480, partial [Chloroflexia bacterium]